MNHTLVLALLCATACGTAEPSRRPKTFVWDHKPITWTFSCDFPEKLKSDWRAGFAYWGLITGTEQFHEIKCDCVCFSESPEVIVSPDVSGRVGPLAYTVVKRDNGLATRASITYFKALTEFPEDSRITVARHETGHVLGLSHNENGGCVMFPIVWPDDGLKPACPGDLPRLLAVNASKK